MMRLAGRGPFTPLAGRSGVLGGRKGVMAGPSTPVFAPVPGIGNVAYYNNLTLGSLVGTAGPAFGLTRATASTTVDWEGLVKNIISGEARFRGLRRVQNLVAGHSNDYTNAAWAKAGFLGGTAPTVTANFAAAPDGSVTASRVVFNCGSGTGNNGSQLIQTITGPAVTDNATAWYLKSNTGSSQKISIAADDTNPIGITVTSAWQKFSITGSSGNPAIQILQLGNWKTADTADILIWGAMDENVGGQSNRNPSEYVSVGALSSPYYGAGVDGVKYFTTQNGNTVASNIVTEATGSALSLTGAGLDVYGASTNIVLQNRDFTQAAWTKGATATVAHDQTGADGTTNGASSFTGGAVTVTNTVLQSITLASSSRSQEAYVKRITGTGTIEMTGDGGTTWTAITGLINSSTYTRVRCAVQTVTNPNVGFRITTSGDKIAVDFVTNTSVVNAPVIQTAGSAVVTNADVPTASGAGIINAAEGTMWLKALGASTGATNRVAFEIDDGTANNCFFLRNSADLPAYAAFNGGVSQVSQPTVAWVANTSGKLAARYRVNDCNDAFNGMAASADTSCTMPTVTTFRLGFVTAGNEPNTTIQAVAYSRAAASDANLQAATA